MRRNPCIERGDRGFARAPEAVSHTVAVFVVSRDGSFPVDAVRLGEGRTGRTKDDVGNVLSICEKRQAHYVQQRQAKGDHVLVSKRQKPLGNGERSGTHGKLLVLPSFALDVAETNTTMCCSGAFFPKKSTMEL